MKKNYLIEGISGTGKTTVGEELLKRGFKVIDADEVFGVYGDPATGLPTEEKSQLNWIWDKNKVDEELIGEPDEIVFVCGGAMNQEKFAHYFKKIFTLYLDDAALRERLMGRTNNSFGKDPDDLARQLEWNKGVANYSKQRGTILIDANKPIEQVADEIISHIADK